MGIVEDLGRYINQFFGWAFERFPYSKAKKWLEIYTNPENALKNTIASASIIEGTKDLVISYLPISLLFALLYGGLMLFTSNFILAIMVFFAIALGFPIITPISTLAYNAVLWVLAKIAGGKGTFTAQYYAFSEVTAGYMIIALVTFIPTMIPCVGYLILLAMIPLFLYLYYLYIKAISIVHGISMMRALVVYLVPIAIFTIIYIGLVMVFLLTPSTRA